MLQKIQLLHPLGKKAISMDEKKYDMLKKSLIKSLKAKKELAHNEIFQMIIKDFETNKIKFEGSIEWHLEWAKLDLEARKVIKRSSGKSGTIYSLVF
jgi:hypothetical protein